MSALHWQPGPYGCRDLLDDYGSLLGYVQPTFNGGFRAFVITRKASGLASFSDMLDHAEEATALAWAEAAARRALPPSGKDEEAVR